MDGYLKITLIVKAGDTEAILEARRVAMNHLNSWFCEVPHTPPYPAGALLSYSIHDDENLSPIGKVSR